MPTYRRRFTTSIAKINARSIDGFFGTGTPCFFIRGTILADAQVDGEYRTLSIQRPGNVIEIEEFDGDWATLVITTRSGNRLGDNLRARMRLRDADLRSVGVDCERIMAGLGTFETPDNPEFVDETHVPDPPPSPPPAPVPVAAPAPPPANGFRKPTLDFDHAATPEPVVAAAPEPEPEPEAEAVAAILPGEKFIPAADVLIVEETGGEPAPDTQAVIERITAKAEPTRTGGTLFGGRTAIADGRVLVEVGTGAIVAIGLPVVLYFLREMFNDKKKKKGGG